MNVALRPTMTLEQFLDWEERQELRYEFDGIAPVAMVGGTAAHSTIQSNLITALNNRLRGTPCRSHGSQLKVEVDGRIRYPDAFVVCTPIAAGETVVREPVILFEIMSDSTQSTDLILKNREYRETASVQRYVVLQQNEIGCMVFSHRNGEWATDLLSGPEAVLAMPEIGIEVPLRELYEGLDFAAAETTPPAP